MNTDTKFSTRDFTEWMRQVDKAIEKRTGMVSADIDDFCYRDCFDDGRTPASTASAAIRNARGMDE